MKLRFGLNFESFDCAGHTYITFISEQKLKYSTIVYMKITCLNRIDNKFDNN